MLLGIRFKANPTVVQKRVLSQWMGCARFIWNAKCEEERYYSTFARKHHPIGTYAPIDQTTAQFKDRELSPWLYKCPSQILRNSAVNWYDTFRKFMKGQCGKPKRKLKSDQGSIHLTRELFSFDKGTDGVLRLFVGTKRNNIGFLSFKAHRSFKIPNSLTIKKERGRYSVSFCYADSVDDTALITDQEHLSYLREATPNDLNQYVVGIDRGVTIPLQAGDESFDFTPGQKKNKTKADRAIKRLQRRLSKQNKGSGHRHRTKHRIATNHAKVANIRRDFSHKTSHALVEGSAKVFIFEDLKITQMTRRPKIKQASDETFLPNHAKSKAGLNRVILDAGWYQLEAFTRYKAYRQGKAVFKIAANHTSQECANCGHIHPDNRKSQENFQCGRCGYQDNADRNASIVIKKRAIKLLQDTGTVLSARGVLSSKPDIGRGAMSKTGKSRALTASGYETSKKKRITATASILEVA